MLRSDLYVVRSRDRDAVNPGGSAPSPADFTLTFPSALHGISRVALASAAIPSGVPNCAAADTFTVDLPAGPTTATLAPPEGFYTITTLTGTVEALLNGVGAGFSVTYDEALGRVTVGRAGDTFALSFAGNLGEMLGFSAAIPPGTSSATGDRLVNMAPLGFFYHLDFNFGGHDFECVTPRSGVLSTAILSEGELVSQSHCYPRPFNSRQVRVRVFNDPATSTSRALANMLSDWEVILRIESN